MLYREIIAVCSEIHTKHINTLCGQNVELLNVKLAVHIVTTESCKITQHAMKMFAELEVNCHLFLTLACKRSDRQVSPTRFILGENPSKPI